VFVLGIETSSSRASVACVELRPDDAGATWGEQADWLGEDWLADGDSALADGVRTVLGTMGITARELGCLAVGLGPGHPTGLHAGITRALTMAEALDVPTYGCCSLDAVDPWGEGERVVVTDAQRGDVYWAEYSADDERVAGPSLLSPAALADALREVGWTGRVVGDGAHLHPTAFPDADPGPRFPSAEGIVLLAAGRAFAHAPTEPLVPMRVRRRTGALPR
jgi:tRNA threonylcarbamoyl adenosine modification protein YeaZ